MWEVFVKKKKEKRKKKQEEKANETTRFLMKDRKLLFAVPKKLVIRLNS